jgi:predicted RNA-binding protein YlqC (UPF0109 family)
MKELIEYVAKALAEDPSRVYVKEIVETRRVIYNLRVAPDDMGRVIGKGGRVANAMRALLRVMAVRKGKQAILKID